MCDQVADHSFPHWQNLPLYCTYLGSVRNVSTSDGTTIRDISFGNEKCVRCHSTQVPRIAYKATWLHVILLFPGSANWARTARIKATLDANKPRFVQGARAYRLVTSLEGIESTVAPAVPSDSGRPESERLVGDDEGFGQRHDATCQAVKSL